MDGKELVKKLARKVADFPVAGVDFIDLTPVFADETAFEIIIDNMLALISEQIDLTQIDLIAGIDARGFILAAAVATKLGTGMLAVRKQGKLPPPVVSVSYQIEYGERTIEIPATGIDYTGKRILIIDDVLATAGTAIATRDLLLKVGAIPQAFLFTIEITSLHGKQKITDLPVVSLCDL